MNPMPELAPMLKRLRLSGVLESLPARNQEAIQNKLAYTCSKAAVYTMTQVLARALGDFDINVNGIAPGGRLECLADLPGLWYVSAYHEGYKAALGAVVPCFLDYKAINFAFEARKLRKIRESDVYRGACHYFLKAPFAVIFTAALVPIIPFYIFRVLSPTSGGVPATCGRPSTTTAGP